VVPGLAVRREGGVVSAACARAVVNDHGRQVVQAAPRIGVPGPGQLLEKVVGHVQAVQREVDEVVEFGPGVGRPAKSFDVKTEYVGKPPDPELLCRRLLGLTGVAEKSLRICQFLRFHELSQAVVNVTVGRFLSVLVLLNGPRELRRYVDGKVEEGVVFLAGSSAVEAGHLGLKGAPEHGGDQGLGLAAVRGPGGDLCEVLYVAREEVEQLGVEAVQHVAKELVRVLLLVPPEPRHHLPDHAEQRLGRNGGFLFSLA